MPATTETGQTNLRSLLRRGARGSDIAAYLDGLPASGRLAECMSVTGRGVRHLYEAVGDNPPLGLEDVVPADCPEATAIIYEGRNSLPTFSRFQKRFARLGSGEVIGYNHQLWSFVTGPGYFVVKPPSPDADVPEELWFDYIAVPAEIPPGWPPFRPNSLGLSRLVYMGMKDYIRRVADGVLVGKAYKQGRAQGAFFTLVRAEC